MTNLTNLSSMLFSVRVHFRNFLEFLDWYNETTTIRWAIEVVLLIKEERFHCL